MDKKILALSIVMTGSFLFTGCGSVISLTDEETNLIAEYSAELLLKHDVNYVDRIADGENELMERSQDELDMEMKQENPAEQPKPSANAGGSGSSTDLGKETGTEENIAKITGMDGVDITYKDYFFTDHYPEGEKKDESVDLEAASGYQLFVLRFQIKNKTENTVSLSLLDKEVDYRLVCNGNHAANPMLTILVDDLGTLETTLEPNQNQEAVLIFQITDRMKDSLDSAKLKVGYHGGDNIINIL